jgi:uncharacterized protein YjlB
VAQFCTKYCCESSTIKHYEKSSVIYYHTNVTFFEQLPVGRGYFQSGHLGRHIIRISDHCRDHIYCWQSRQVKTSSALMNVQPKQFHLHDDGIFPNSKLPAVLYKGILQLPTLLPGTYVNTLFRKNNWTNYWKHGIFEYHHYHSITHEVLGVYKGETMLQLGGEQGVKIHLEKGDVLIIPAGVAHKNLGKENQLKCVGAYPGGRDYDMNYGKEGERPKADENIAAVPAPATDPIFGAGKGVATLWR